MRLAGLSGLHRNSPQRLNISSIMVFDQTRDPEIPITLRPYDNIQHFIIELLLLCLYIARRAGSDGSMSASGSAGPAGY